jgi:hypothetical protein
MPYTYAQFVARVKELMPKDGVRLGVETTLSRLILQATIDIQSKVEKFRSGNETIYEAVDTIADGNASRVRVPENAMIDEVWLIQVDESDDEEECVKMPLDVYPWVNRSHLTCSTVCINGQRGFYTIDVQRANLIAYPKIEDPNRLLIVWTGIKTDYEDDDVVPFDERCVLAAADFASAKIALTVNRDRQMHDTYMQNYVRTLRGVFVDALK